MMKTKIFKIRLDENFLIQDQEIINQFLADHKIVSSTTAYVHEGNFWSVLFLYESKDKRVDTAFIIQENKEYIYNKEEIILNNHEEKILLALKLWRTDRAKEQKIPLYCIASNKELLALAKTKPLKREDLQSIKGFGKHKVESYGDEIITLIESLTVFH